MCILEDCQSARLVLANSMGCYFLAIGRVPVKIAQAQWGPWLLANQLASRISSTFSQSTSRTVDLPCYRPSDRDV